MHYALTGAGKRVRPVLTLAVADLFGARSEPVLDLACAVEMVHACSLVLDDLPSMDDAALRRGRPTVHRAFGENVALLAALGLLNRAYALVAEAHHRLSLRRYAGVTDALALVGLRLAQLADLGRDLTHELLVDADDAELGRALGGERDALGGVEHDRVAVAELELELRGALGQHAVTHAHDLELLLVALGDTHHHVADQGAGQTVERTALTLVVGAGHLEDAVLGLRHLDGLGHGVAQRALGALDGHQRVVDRDVDTGRDRDGELANTRHASLSPSWSQWSGVTRRRRGLRRPRPSGSPDGR